MATAAWPLQVAVITRLRADPELTAMCGVYDNVPEPAPYPHVAVGEVVEEPDDTHDNQGLTVALTLHVWSKYRGYAETATILAHLDRLLDRRPLAVDGFQDVTVFREWSRLVRDPDPTIRHCPVRYRVWLSTEE
ncbi:DUF3168 domain-containing protein [Allonocardiopsis opalescens]|uniref:Uncharacterized protein DUF3168 n=1 Tax=Allonocardiopsis opalescens TaxID=1144618 RepID=A0A2T0PPK0_9ACTN|nr:DUF3168 domain-containing protein [Allonocardiopsis opalescens]PRX90823.1 uncharacterized protein DUF3168 [Allonocardiopsis opalescens]